MKPAEQASPDSRLPARSCLAGDILRSFPPFLLSARAARRGSLCAVALVLALGACGGEGGSGVALGEEAPKRPPLEVPRSAGPSGSPLATPAAEPKDTASPAQKTPPAEVSEEDTRYCWPDELLLALALEKNHYLPGETIRMSLVVRNEARRNCVVRFRSSQRDDFLVYQGHRDDDRRIWALRACEFFLALVQEETWEPGHTETYRASWNQTRNADGREKQCTRTEPAGIDTYVAVASFHGVFGASAVSSRAVTFRVG